LFYHNYINLSPIQSAPVSFPIQEIDTTKRFEEPKSFNVSSQRYNMQGPSDYYNYNQEGVDYETAMRVQRATEAYNKYIEEKYGNPEALKNPKAAERLKQLRQDVQITPQYQMGGYVYPVNYVPQAQDGFTSFMSNLGDNIVEFFSDEKEEKIKPIKKTSVKKSGNKDNTRTLNIVDPRKKLATTNQPLRPNSDLVGGKYSSKHLDRLIQEAKRQGMSKQDIMNLSAMGFQETKWGKTDGNIGHVMGDWGGDDDYQLFINAYNAKMKEADRLGITDPAMRLQVYNGLGTITPSTEKDYHGFEMQKIYGVPIPKGGISMKKNPLYGKQVMDIRDNVLAKNPEYIKYMDSIYKAPLKKKAMGGSIPGAVGFTYARTKGIPSEGPYAKKTMPSAQEGRTITIDEGDGKKRKILTDSSEYAKLYNEGRIGVQNDDESISFNPLNEVVVTPYDKQFPYYQQLTPSEQKYLRENLNSNDPITRQLKARATDGRGFDADKATDFAMGWLRDLPLASLQAPQSALVEGVEALRGNDYNFLDAITPGEQRRPSDVWGIENDYYGINPLNPMLPPVNYKTVGNTAMDIVTDPLLIEGLARQPLQQGLNKAGKALGTESGLLSNTYKLNPFANKKVPMNKLFHGSDNPNLLLDDIKFTEPNPNVGSRPGQFKRRAIESGDPLEMPGGFYTNDRSIPKFMGNAPYRYSMEIPANSKVFKWESGVSDNISVKKLQELKNKGYDVIEGKNILGETEHIPLNKDLISNWKMHQKGAPELELLKDSNFETITPHWLKGYKKIPKQEDGGVIKDDLGQWKHPGEITEINSPYITMKGVPYPVLGISDTGDTQMMYPEEEYEFDGTKVTEFPMAKNGLRQEQKGLVNLDNLLNFTNYNTKQPGGWLDKYSK